VPLAVVVQNEPKTFLPFAAYDWSMIFLCSFFLEFFVLLGI
jgi:hypothetical protein